MIAAEVAAEHFVDSSLGSLAHAARTAAVLECGAGLLTEAGFEHLRTEMLDLDPPTACVLGHVAPADDAKLAARSTAQA